jgi:hypothetical protein
LGLKEAANDIEINNVRQDEPLLELIRWSRD